MNTDDDYVPDYLITKPTEVMSKNTRSAMVNTIIDSLINHSEDWIIDSDCIGKVAIHNNGPVLRFDPWYLMKVNTVSIGIVDGYYINKAIKICRQNKITNKVKAL